MEKMFKNVHKKMGDREKNRGFSKEKRNKREGVFATNYYLDCYDFSFKRNLLGLKKKSTKL